MAEPIIIVPKMTDPWAWTAHFPNGSPSLDPLPLWGGVTFANDGSVGDTFNAPSGMTSIQWYRWTLGSNVTKTAIVGATGNNYIATVSDGPSTPEVPIYRLVARGMLNGVLTDAICWVPVLQASAVLFVLDSTAGATTTGSPTLSLTGGKLTIQGTGVTNAEARWNNLKSEDPTTWGVVAGTVDISKGDKFIIQNARVTPVINGTDAYVANVTTAANPGNLSVSNTPIWWGQKPFAFHRDEIPGGTTSGVVPVGIALRHSGAASNTGRTVYAEVRKLAKGWPILVMYADDNIDNQFSVMKPILDSFGYKATFALAPDLLGLAGRLTEAQIIQLHNEGHDICVDGRRDAQPGPNYPMDGPTGTITGINYTRSWLDARGMGRARDHLVYEYGFISQTPLDPFYKGATATSDGSNVLTITSPTGSGTVAAGWKVYGDGIPDGVTATGAMGGTLTVSANIPARAARLITLVDDSNEYHPWKFPDRLALEGFKTARRAGLGGINYARQGWGDTALNMATLDLASGGSGGNFTTQLKPTVDLWLKRGGVLTTLNHGVSATPTGNDTSTTTLIDFLTYIKASDNAGGCGVMTVSPMWAATGTSKFIP